MSTTILLDADVPAYQFAAKGQKEVIWDDGDDPTIIPPDPEEARESMVEYIDGLKDELAADDIVLCFSDADRRANWRLDVLPSYKSNRDPRGRPVLHDMMERFLEDTYETIRRPRLEGDDVMGILATNPKVIKGRKVIVTIDKDLRTIPNRKTKRSENLLYHIPKVGKAKLEHITEAEADWYWMYQTIIGDTTDGYKGCPGAGPVKARSILGDIEDAGEDTLLRVWWPAVVELYESKGLTVDDALAQARVARIARHEDFDYRHKRVIPWSPDF